MLFFREIKVGELLRRRTTKEAYIVVAKSTQGLFVVNLHARNNPAILQFLLPAQTDEYRRDQDIDKIEEDF